MSDDDGQARIPQRLKYGEEKPFATAYPLKRSCSEGKTVAIN
jgi:hypothetical protein